MVLKKNTLQFKSYTKNAISFKHLFRSQYAFLNEIIEILLGKHIKRHNFKKESRRYAISVAGLRSGAGGP